MTTESPSILSPCLRSEVEQIAAQHLSGPRKDRFLRAHEFVAWLYFNVETSAEEEAAVKLYRELAKV